MLDDFETSDLSKSQNVFLAFQDTDLVISFRNNPSHSVYTWAHTIPTELNNYTNDLEVHFFSLLFSSRLSIAISHMYEYDV